MKSTCKQYLYFLNLITNRFQHCFAFIFIAGAFFNVSCFAQDTNNTITSPDNQLVVHLYFSTDRKVYYDIRKNGNIVLDRSRLGIEMENDDYASDLQFVSATVSEIIQDNYSMAVGKKKHIRYRANKRGFLLKNKNGNPLDIIFQVSNDGVAFRYLFTAVDDKIHQITAEKSSFHFPNGSFAFLQPMADAKTSWARTNPSYEENYLTNIITGTASPNKAGWIFPALFKTDHAWVLLSEADLGRNYCASRLNQLSPDNEYSIGFPQSPETWNNGPLLPQSAFPWTSPWRIITVGSLQTIVESTLGTDLAKPEVKIDKSFIKPGRASWSWVLLKDDSTVYDVQKRFIDYAADMHWEYCLIDAGWDKQIGYEKIATLSQYALSKGVGLLLWYNSAGPWNDTYQTPKDMMLTHDSRIKEFQRIKKMGICGVKVDFFGGDGQSFISYYQDILDDAASVGLMVNFHGCTLPRGWQRTYPQLVSMEAIKGMEFITFLQANADKASVHCTMIPYARNVFDPMDFTPVAFSEIPNIQRRTSNAFELALSVVFVSGIQHFAETPSGMSKVPAYVKNFMRDVPVSWEDTKFIDGYPGKYYVVARKSLGKWYIAGISSDSVSIKVKLNLPFLENTVGEMITDGINNRSFSSSQVAINNHQTEVEIKPNGGFVITIPEKVNPAFLKYAPTPPMGWNSWDCYGPTVTEAEVKENADYMAKHLKKHGWEYIVVDIRWYIQNDKAHGYNEKDAIFCMDEYGRLTPSVIRFPSAANNGGFKSLADYVHHQGLKFGIHIMRGIPKEAVKKNTPVLGTNLKAEAVFSEENLCRWLGDMYTVVAENNGAQEYYNSLFNLYASWGVDFVKVDDLSAPIYHGDEIEMIRKAIDQTGRAMVLSTSPGETPLIDGNHVSNHANQWRIVDDFWDNWPMVKDHFEVCNRWASFSGSGHWPDADMLPLGNIGLRAERGDKRMCALTHDEQMTMMSLWCIFRSPLIFGGNLPGNDAFTLSLITNDELLYINQHSTNNRQLFRDGDKIGWIADDPKTGDKFLALFNIADSTVKNGKTALDDVLKIVVKSDMLGMMGTFEVHDCWTGKDLGKVKGEIVSTLRPHASAMYRLSEVK